jgi:hypothetical protein
MTSHDEHLEAVKARFRLKVPKLKKSIGAGDIVREVTEALGIEHCAGCDRRQERLNRFLQFDSYLEESEQEIAHEAE